MKVNLQLINSLYLSGKINKKRLGQLLLKYLTDKNTVGTADGGDGSGNFGHSGRPGKVGGSSSEAATVDFAKEVLKDKNLNGVKLEKEFGITTKEFTDRINNWMSKGKMIFKSQEAYEAAKKDLQNSSISEEQKKKISRAIARQELVQYAVDKFTKNKSIEENKTGTNKEAIARENKTENINTSIDYGNLKRIEDFENRMPEKLRKLGEDSFEDAIGILNSGDYLTKNDFDKTIGYMDSYGLLDYSTVFENRPPERQLYSNRSLLRMRATPKIYMEMCNKRIAGILKENNGSFENEEAIGELAHILDGYKSASKVLDMTKDLQIIGSDSKAIEYKKTIDNYPIKDISNVVDKLLISDEKLEELKTKYVSLDNRAYQQYNGYGNLKTNITDDEYKKLSEKYSLSKSLLKSIMEPNDFDQFEKRKNWDTFAKDINKYTISYENRLKGDALKKTIGLINDAPVTEGVMYRGFSTGTPFTNKLAQMPVGKTVNMPTPRSFTANLDIAAYCTGSDNPVIMRVKGGFKGLFINNLSNFPDQAEILTTGKFKITSNEVNKNGVRIIDVEQLNTQKPKDSLSINKQPTKNEVVESRQKMLEIIDRLISINNAINKLKKNSTPLIQTTDEVEEAKKSEEKTNEEIKRLLNKLVHLKNEDYDNYSYGNFDKQIEKLNQSEDNNMDKENIKKALKEVAIKTLDIHNKDLMRKIADNVRKSKDAEKKKVRSPSEQKILELLNPEEIEIWDRDDDMPIDTDDEDVENKKAENNEDDDEDDSELGDKIEDYLDEDDGGVSTF